jgi:predicted DNA-binding transcriptional regulator AlpA
MERRKDRAMPATPALGRMLRPGEICEVLGWSRQGLWKARRRGDFPEGKKFGPNSIGWPEDEFRKWLASRPAA